MVWRSPISALQVGMVEIVKFNHEFALFFAHILLKNDIVQCHLNDEKYSNDYHNIKSL